jgi:uncharacterized protein (TIGR03435 family)
MNRTIAAALLACSSAVCFGQTGNLSPSFEVASIKPAAPPSDPHRMMVGMRGGPGTPDPGQITFSNVSLRNVLMQAYDVKDFQISGPSWLGSERYDITAKVPPGTTKEQFRLMLQNLLAERFQVSLHHETKELPMYALVVAKGGVKMKESVDAPAPPTDDGGPKAMQPGYGGPMPKPTMGKDGMPQMPPGGMKGGMMMSFTGSRMRMQANGVQISQLVNMLANQLSRPVVDQTGLTAKYDYTLDFAPEPGQAHGPNGPMMAGGPGGGKGEGPAGDSNDAGPNLVTAVQEQLGLKLEAKKGPVDLLVIDRAEKAPTEN